MRTSLAEPSAVRRRNGWSCRSSEMTPPAIGVGTGGEAMLKGLLDAAVCEDAACDAARRRRSSG